MELLRELNMAIYGKIPFLFIILLLLKYDGCTVLC